MNVFATTEFKELLEATPQLRAAPTANTVAHIFRYEQKENFISDWLAFLLNPKYVGSAEPLTALLQLASVTTPVDLYDVSVFREVSFEDKRRIDFIIETGSHIIGIENKIWSDLQKRQLSDYRKQLTSRAAKSKKELVLILLYPRRNECCSTLTEKTLCGFHSVTYEDLVFEFKQIRLNIFENLRAVVLMEDFILHMEEYIMKEFDIKSNFAMWQFEKENRERITRWQDALKESNNQFNEYVKAKIGELICGRPDEKEWKIYTASTYIQLYKASWETCNVHFELLKKELVNLPPNAWRVVLHTHEQKNKPRTDYLRNLGQDTEKQIDIDYSSQEKFEESMNRVFEALKDLVNTYTQTIDEEIAKTPLSSRQ